jgi:hypothetical protein
LICINKISESIGENEMKKRMSKFFFMFAAIFAVGLLTDVANAQPRRARGKVYTKAEVDAIIKRVENRADNFKKEFDKALDKSRLDGSDREDELNQYAKDLEKQTDELRREFDRRDLWIENKEEVRRCLATATKINVAMRNRKLGRDVETTWAALRYELNTLAKVYNLPLVGSSAY